MLKRSVKLLSFVIFSAFIFNACQDSSVEHNTIVGSGNIVSEIRSISDCTGIEIISAGNVYLTQDTTQLIRIEADDNIISDVITREENGILLTGLTNKSYSNITLKIYVSLKAIQELSVTGAGNIECTKAIQVDNLYSVINGAGNINLEGTANSFECIINGAGNVNAKDFIVKNCMANVNGAGNCSVNVTGNLKAVVTGVGSIFYYGNPINVTSSVTGIGQIIRK